MQNQDVGLLILREGDGCGQIWSLSRPEIIIGRDESCDIVLDDRKVSRRHASIRRQPDGYYITDLQSKNGTFVNGEAVFSPRRLYDGDEIQIALCYRLAFVDAGATVPLSLEETFRRGLVLDKEARMVYLHQKALDPPLSPAQFRLLELLYDNCEHVVSREEIVAAVWPDESAEGITEQAIDALVRRLRERLAELDPSWQFVVTVRGHGFRFNRP
ncbi:MAG: FHA domain-containing protein [Anaerolineae bacterium]